MHLGRHLILACFGNRIFNICRETYKNGRQVAELLDAILLPSALAFIKVSGHSRADIAEAKGNSSRSHHQNSSSAEW